MIGCAGHDGDYCIHRERMEKDAARYRWLREQKASGGGYWVAHGRINQGLSQWYGQPLDDAIDAAMIKTLNANVTGFAPGKDDQ